MPVKVNHIITRLIVGGAQEHTTSFALGLRKEPDFEVRLMNISHRQTVLKGGLIQVRFGVGSAVPSGLENEAAYSRVPTPGYSHDVFWGRICRRFRRALVRFRPSD